LGKILPVVDPLHIVKMAEAKDLKFRAFFAIAMFIFFVILLPTAKVAFGSFCREERFALILLYCSTDADCILWISFDRKY